MSNATEMEPYQGKTILLVIPLQEEDNSFTIIFTDGSIIEIRAVGKMDDPAEVIFGSMILGDNHVVKL